MKEVQNSQTLKWIYFWLIVTCSLVSLPFLAAKFPPITDLSQLLAQVQSFWDAVNYEQSIYQINWIVPHSLAHFLFVATVGVAGYEYGGALAMWMLSLSNVIGFFILAIHFKRPLYSAVLSSVLVFNINLYWGFAAFLIGWPLFVAYIIQISSKHELNKKNAPILFLLVTLLYFSHLLWFIAAGLWLVFFSLTTRKTIKSTLRQCGVFIPLTIPMLLWKYSIKGENFDHPWTYVSNPLERLSIIQLAQPIGGLNGLIPVLLILVVIFVLLIHLMVHRGEFKKQYDRTLFVTGCFFLGFYLLLPDAMTSTIGLNRRWLPYGLGCLLMAPTAIQCRKVFLQTICVLTLGVLSLKTTQAWRYFEEKELSGFDEILTKLPHGKKVIGLDFKRNSEVIKGLPFMQIFAYGQVLKNANMPFSFAEFPTSFVVYRNPPASVSDKNFEWIPWHFEVNDLNDFDYSIVHMSDDGPIIFNQINGLTLEAKIGNFGLFRIDKHKLIYRTE